jgi:hypothetical protein
VSAAFDQEARFVDQPERLAAERSDRLGMDDVHARAAPG